ncbi:hypothetical protein ACTMTI_16215 [Nonomuraea sp. H19]|uniref:hypothetical protein n=1 Tax=Nonomuraea sp. H19 TaxID=3452206 RepID=UPI003F8CD018
MLGFESVPAEEQNRFLDVFADMVLGRITFGSVFFTVAALTWSPPALAVVLWAAAIAHVWGLWRLVRGVAVTPSPPAARLLFLQPAICVAYLAVCSFDVWFTSVTARPATAEEVAWGGMPEGLVRDGWAMIADIGIAMVVVSVATVAMGVAARRGHAGLWVLAGMVTPLYLLGMTLLAAIGPLGPIAEEMRLAAELRCPPGTCRWWPCSPAAR